ncbi:MAG: TRIC cation channel family protein [Clostridia bacterium]|nr:TRIC cation channel family protein [Clostridia bacterium]
METAFGCGFKEKALFSVSMGVITGIDGGIVRDILVGKIPLETAVCTQDRRITKLLQSCIY